MSGNITPLQKLTSAIRTLAPVVPTYKSPVMRALDSYAKTAPAKSSPTLPRIPEPGALPFNFATCTVGIAESEDDAYALDLCSLKTTSASTAKGFAERAKAASNVVAGALSGCTALPMKPMAGFEGEFYTAKESAAAECMIVDAALTAYGLGTAIVGGEATVASLGSGAAVGVPAMAVGVAAAGVGAAMAPLHAAAREEARANKPLESRRLDAKAVDHKPDASTGKTAQSHSYYRSEGEARAHARKMVGRDPVKFEDNKLRSWDGRWQYRAKPVDVNQKHVHIEKLDPNTGNVISNIHLHW
jgi:hypothetical protein